MTVLKSGDATLVGQVRPENQDNLVVAEDLQLFAVTDGMGGHRGGEIASEVAAETLKSAFTDKSTTGLAHAVQASNEAVVTKANGDSSLKGMGTTLCALALVNVDGQERLAAANVGDSRLYLLRATTDQLEQITEDHSLVETLYRQGQLTKAEAEAHPHRNILTRALGIEADVLVDLFELLPVPGDRYVLCSDGLFNEVTEELMSIVLRQEDDPKRASEELARLADEAGGRDNITVVVVDVVAGPNGATAAASPDTDRLVNVERADEQPIEFPAVSGAAPAAPPPPDAPPLPPPPPTEPQPLVTGPDGEPVPAAPDETAVSAAPAPSGAATAVAAPVVVQPSPAFGGGAAAGVPAPAEQPRGTRFTWRVALFLVVLAAVVAAVIFAFSYFANNTFYVGFDGDQVAIFRGRQGGILFIGPTVAEATGISRADVPKDRLQDIEKGKDEPSLAEAQIYVQNLRDQINQQRQQVGLGGAVGQADPGSPTTAVPPPSSDAPDSSTPSAGGAGIFPPGT
ncbi:MAG: Stp1/IreP family PP2C-type Ser/Thr phosphatase [Actinobacteria bacterium]|nr:Stp1/IreP family PP2C-type Ser/Thr phosphatase [Actinomycetota bacterium]